MRINKTYSHLDSLCKKNLKNGAQFKKITRIQINPLFEALSIYLFLECT